jgi:hypothetical protein
MKRLLLALLIAAACAAGEEAEIPYAPLHALTGMFPDLIRFRISCRIEDAQPLALDIRIDGAPVAAIPVDGKGFMQLPRNESWLQGTAMLHANRPKGTMDLSAVLVPYSFDKLVLTDGAADLKEFVERVAWGKAQHPRFLEVTRQLGKPATMFYCDNWIIQGDPRREFSIIIDYEKEGAGKRLSRKSIAGRVAIDLNSLYGSSRMVMTVDPPDTRLVYDLEKTESRTVTPAP